MTATMTETQAINDPAVTVLTVRFPHEPHPVIIRALHAAGFIWDGWAQPIAYNWTWKMSRPTPEARAFAADLCSEE